MLQPPPLARPAAQPLARAACWSRSCVGLALTPFLFPGTKALNVAAKILVFIVLVASFDLLLGYTGIVSFAHTMFFGIGAYGVAIASTRLGPGWRRGRARRRPRRSRSRCCCRCVIGLFSLRVKAIFFAMITLAVASAFLTLASQLSDFTGGEDGLTFKVPEALQPGTRVRSSEPFLGASIDGRFVTYYLLFFVGAGAGPGAAAHRQLAVRPRAAGDPRERLPRRGDRLPHRRLPHARRTCCRRCSRRSPACLLALWLRYNGPDTTLSFEIMLDILLIVVIGGMGTMYGAVVGSVLFVLAQNYLQDLMKLGAARGRRRAGAVAARLARPLAAVARHPVRAVGLLLPERRRRAAARDAREALTAVRVGPGRPGRSSFSQ